MPNWEATIWLPGSSLKVSGQHKDAWCWWWAVDLLEKIETKSSLNTLKRLMNAFETSQDNLIHRRHLNICEV